MADDIITLLQVAESLGRVCQVHPTTAPDYRLHPDASLLAELYGLMIYKRSAEVRLIEISEPIRAALQRWEI